MYRAQAARRWAAVRMLGLGGMSVTCAALCPVQASAATATFDLGLQGFTDLLPREAAEWEYTLGTPFGGPINIGDIVGKKDALIIPEVKILGETIIPEVRGDTRTGLRLTSNLEAFLGFRLYAGFDPGGVATGGMLDLNPTLNTPDLVQVGQFNKLGTSTGIIGVTNLDIDLPSVEFGAQLDYELDFRGQLEYALIGVGYDKQTFGINVDETLDIFKFDFDLNVPSFPEVQFPFDIDFALPQIPDAEGDVFRKQLSAKVPRIPGARIDWGEFQVVKPVNENVKTSTRVESDKLGYSVEAVVGRFGLDIDGLLQALVTPNPITRFEFNFGSGTVGKLVAELIDAKYGPEIGLRYDNEVTPSLLVTLTFSEAVAINDGGTISRVTEWTGRWDQLPEIALLGSENVDVDVQFTNLLVESKDSAYVTLADYLELRALELDLNVGFKALKLEAAGLGPVLHKRTSLIGDIGELAIFEDRDQGFAIFDLPDAVRNADFGFMLTAAESELLYARPGRTNFGTFPQNWLTLANHAEWDSSILGTTLIIATDDGTAEHVGELDAVAMTDRGNKRFKTVTTSSGQVTEELDDFSFVYALGGLIIPDGSELVQRGVQTWQVPVLVNDGLYHGEDSLVRFTGAVLSIEGSGEMVFDTPVEFNSAFTIIGADQTIRLGGGEFQAKVDLQTIRTHVGLGSIVYYDTFNEHLIGGSVFENSGTIEQEAGTLKIASSQGIVNRRGGRLSVLTGAAATVTSPRILNDGLIEARGSDASITFTAAPYLNSGANSGGVYRAADGGKLTFLNDVRTGESYDTGGGPLPAQRVRFEAMGGTVEFKKRLMQEFGNGENVIELETDATGTIILNGIQFPTVTTPLGAQLYEGTVDIVNHGTLEIVSGRNLLFVDEEGPLGSGTHGDPPPVPQIRPLNLVNEGLVRIHKGAEFGFEVEIEDYRAGGATFNLGKWELIGAPVALSNVSNPANFHAASTAQLRIDVVKIRNEDTFLGEVDFGDGQPYDVEDFDTFLAINESDITLSGAAYFPYLNTMRENRGRLALKLQNRFFTAGDLLNTGVIEVGDGGRLDVMGDLTVDEGTVTVSSQGTLSVGSNAINVIGGNVTIQRSGTLFVNTPWTVREKWVGLDDDGNDIILPSVVSYGAGVFQRIGGSAKIIVDGAAASFEPLKGITQLEGDLTLTNGHVLDVTQSLTNQGRLEVTNGAQLRINRNFFNIGHMVIGENSYLKANLVSLSGGTVVLDGVIDAPQVYLSETVTVTGSSVISGSLVNGAKLAIGNSPGKMELFSGFAQELSGELEMELLGQEAGVGFDQIEVHGGDTHLAGALKLIFGENFAPALNRQWVLLQVAGTESFRRFGMFDDVQTMGLLDPGPIDFEGLVVLDPQFDLHLGTYDGESVLLSYYGGDGNDVVVYTTPEPGTLVMVAAGALLAGRRRRAA